MNKLIVEILPYIKREASRYTSDKELIHDITQDVVLKCYDNQDSFKDAYNNGKIEGYLFILIQNRFMDEKRKKPFTELNKDLINETKELLPIDRVRRLDKMLNELGDIERMWIVHYLECNLNISELHRRTGISRRHAKERINVILKKWKQLDIYL